ncbi:vigilin isoform X1 [Drosophila pseudoobscura]|uniref:Vigilin isoform X1 n=2 Tax=Drosophila pseudoobscura pseudoobscura TaxID=46245 RepID=A0A6I8VFH9_DROPS|nr:vigilin isoform X1 [Drosophila pseudoobscura]XP_015040209.1 vigilin isoform X1 [Drosophila pseudoobscura]
MQAAAAVMEESNATSIEQQPIALINGQEQVSNEQQPSSPTSVATPTSTNSGGTGNATPAFSYDDLFPALPANTSAPALSGPSSSSLARVTSSQKTQVLHVPCDERKSTESDKFGEGESKRICQQITKETGAQIEIVSGKNQSLTFLIKGKQSELLDARRKILMSFSTQASRQVTVPREHYRVILGKGGQRLRDLERLTSTRINIPSQGDESEFITIAGTKEGIEKAEQEIRQLSAEQYKKSSDRTTIPKIYHPFIVGPYSENLNKLQEETGAKINVPPQQVQKDEIIISGEKDAVAAAKAKVEAIYKEMEKKCSTVSVEVAKPQHRYVIGPKGSTIAEILQLTGVSVEMPPNDSTLETITLRGPQVALGNALTVVYQKANSVKSVEINAPHWIHKYVIGRKGANMKQLEEDCPNVNVNCLEDKIKLEGDPENVDKAISYLTEIIRNYEENFTYEVMTVNPSYYKHIIGKAGSNVNRLKDELKVNINIEEREGQNNIRIEGPKEGVRLAQLELQEKIDKLENEKSKDVIIDRRLHRSIIGAKGEKIREVKDRYRQVTITIPTPQENTDIVKLRGPKEDVDKCHKDLMKLVKEIQESSHIIEVPIFKQFHKFVIGKGGANIKKIRDETQTKIDLPAEGDTNEVIVITGKKENVLEAKERIQKIQNELSDIVSEEVQIPPKYYNSIIGTGGKLISSIMEECGGVSIKFPNSDSKSDKVTIRGPKDDVEKAKGQLLELANERQLASFTAEVRAKQQHHKFLIGKNGASIRKIRDATGARIIFPSNEDTDKEVITIIGKEDSVKKAKEQLEAIIKECDEVTEGEVAVDPKHHKYFVAKRGLILHRIAEENGGVMISFPRAGTNSDKVTLKGAKDCIEAAKQRIEEIVADLEAQTTIEVIIPQRQHRTIMGARGFKVQQVTSEFDVQIKFPDRDATDPVEGLTNGGLNGEGQEGEAAEQSSGAVDGAEPVRQCDVIRITGRIDKCEAAKQALLDLIPIEEELSVPFDLHRTIIGPRGANVRQFMSKHDVHVELPPSELKSDIIKVSGTPAHVAEAKEALEKMIEDFEADRADRELRSFVLQLDVDQEYHSKLIGRHGAVINKLRADHDVNISLPKRDDPNQRIISITGYQAKAEAARDAILEIVGDLQTLHREVIEIDTRVHSHIIGQRGRTIRKIIEDYKVDIKFPSSDDAQNNPNAVTIIGKEEDVENAKDVLLSMAEDYERDYLENLPPSPQPQTVGAFLTGTGGNASSGSGGAGGGAGAGANENGFIIKDAPWEKQKQQAKNLTAPNTQSQEDFPNFAAGGAPVASTPITSVWGPKN